MEDNFDTKIFYYCKVRCSFIVGNMSPWKTGQKLYPKGPHNGLNRPVWVQATSWRCCWSEFTNSYIKMFHLLKCWEMNLFWLNGAKRKFYLLYAHKSYIVGKLMIQGFSIMPKRIKLYRVCKVLTGWNIKNLSFLLGTKYFDILYN